MKVMTGSLALGFSIVLLLLIRYVRSVEGFADKPVAVYDSAVFFAPFQLTDICPIWTTVYTNFQGGYKTDEKGQKLPDDVVKKATDAAIATALPSGVFPCPFSFPTGTSLDTVLAWLKTQDKQLLLRAHMTLVFCKRQLDSTYATAQKSLLDMKNKGSDGFADMFLTECSAEELSARDILPLQCIDPAVELGTEANQIKAQDTDATAAAVKKKIEITKRLTEMWTTYTAGVPVTQRIDFSATIKHCNERITYLAELKKKLESGQTSF